MISLPDGETSTVCVCENVCVRPCVCMRRESAPTPPWYMRRETIYPIMLSIFKQMGNAASSCGETGATTTTTPAAAAKLRRNGFIKHHKYVKGRAKCVQS